MQKTDSSTRIFPLLVFVYWLVLCGPFLTQVPVWDSATGIFPAAAYLAHTNFDITTLVMQEGWAGGGPNTYSFSPLTWLTALVIRWAPSRESGFALLHLVQGFLTIGMCIATARLFEPLGSMKYPLALLCVTFPVVSVQTTYMYSEIALTLVSVLMLNSCLTNKLHQTALLGVVAVSLKLSGIIPVLAVVALLVWRRPKYWFRNVLLIGILGGGMGLLILSYSAPGNPPSHYVASLIQHVLMRVVFIPEIGFLVVVSMALAIRILVVKEPDMRKQLLSFFALVYCGFYMLVPGITEFWMLPRYFIQVIPVSVGLVYLYLAKFGFRWVATAAVITTILNLANLHGALYPEYRGVAFSLVERDMRYREYLDFHKIMAASASQLPPKPVLVSREMFYFLTYPELGYVEDERENVHFVGQAFASRIPALHELPDDFFIILSNPGHGGEILSQILGLGATADSHYIRRLEIDHGRYRGYIIEISRRDGK